MAKIKRFDILKMAYFMGLYGVVLGLIAAIFMLLFSTILSSLISTTSIPGAETSLLGFRWISILLFPLIYGVGGFLSGLILTPIINLILRIIKGIDLDIKMSAK